MNTSEIIELINNIWPYIVMFGGLIYGWLAKRYGLPPIVIAAIKALNRAGINEESITAIIATANDVKGMSDNDRRSWVVKELKTLADRNGIELKDSTANLLVEWIYKRLKTA